MPLIFEKLIEYGIYLVAFFTPLIFLKNTKVNFLLPKESFLTMMIPLLLWLWLSKEIVIKHKKWRFSPIIIPILIYTLSIFLSWINSTNLSYSISASTIMLNYITMFFIIFYNVRKERIINNTVFLLILAGGLVALYGILQYFRIDPFFGKGEVQGNVGKMEVFSTFGNPNFLSPYLAATLPLAITFIFHRMHKIWMATTSVILSILITACLVLAFARSSWVGAGLSFMVMFGLMFIFNKSFLRLLFSKKAIILYLIIFIGSIALIWGFASTEGSSSGKGISSIIYYFKDRFTQMDNVWERFLQWNIALHASLKHPIIGKGIFAYKMHYPELQADFYKDPENFKNWYKYGVCFRHTHNDYIQTLYEQGLLGLLSFLSIVGVFLYMIIKLIKTDKKNFYLYLGFAGGAVGVLGDALSNFPFRRAAPQLTYYIILGFTALLFSIKVKKEAPEEPELNAGIIKILFQLLIFIPIFFWIKQYSFNYLIGNQYLKAGYVTLLYFHKPKQAIELFERSEKLYPDNSDLWYWKGVAYHIQKKYDKALSTFEKALTFSTNNLIYYQIGLIKKETGHPEEAIKYFQKSIDIIPRFMSGYIQLAEYYQRKGDYKKAVKYLENIDEYKCRAQRDSREKQRTYLMMAQLHFNLGNYEKSIINIKKYLPYSSNIEKKSLFNMLEQILMKLKKQPDEIADIFDKMDKYFPDDLFFDERLGAINFKAKRYKKSIYYWSRHLNDAQKKGAIYYNIAACYFYLKDYEKAEKFVKKSLIYEPNFKKSIDLRAILEKMNK